jgi:hypothetical protein
MDFPHNKLLFQSQSHCYADRGTASVELSREVKIRILELETPWGLDLALVGYFELAGSQNHGGIARKDYIDRCCSNDIEDRHSTHLFGHRNHS